MWSILSDNLSAYKIMEACNDPNGNEFKNNFYIQKYLYSLILWETIYVAHRTSYSRKIYEEKILYEQGNELIKRVKNTFNDIPYRYYDCEIKPVVNTFFNERCFEAEFDQKVMDDATFYLALGQIQNMNVQLSEQRARFIEMSGIAKEIWSREDILKYVDKEVFEIYKDVHSFMGKNVVSIQTPLLIDYICQNATCLQDAINIAFQLREEKDIVQFRDAMNSLDNAINEGNIILIKEYEDMLSEITNQFIRNEIATSKIDIGFTITLSISNPSFEVAFGIPIKRDSKKKINMNFLLDLARYGLTQGYRKNKEEISTGF